jgi:hypothetical protein
LLITQYPQKPQTLFLPFGSPASPAEYKDLGRQMSDRLVNEITALQRDLKSDMSALAHDGARGGSAGATSGGNAEDTWAGTQELEFGGFRVPVRLLIAPIDGPIQRLLNVRVIEGTVQVENIVGSDLQSDLAQAVHPTPTPAPRRTADLSPTGTPQSPTPTPRPATPCVSPHDIVVLASSSDGDTWRAERTTCAAGDESWRSQYDAVQGLAFNIWQADPALAKGRFTDTYAAFQRFEEGLKEWNAFETMRSDWNACAIRAASDESRNCAKLYQQWGKCREEVIASLGRSPLFGKSECKRHRCVDRKPQTRSEVHRRIPRARVPPVRIIVHIRPM